MVAEVDRDQGRPGVKTSLAHAMSFADEILSSLQTRDAREQVHAAILDDYRRLAQGAALLKERNQILLKAATSTKGIASNNGQDNPVRVAYISSLESQINSLRDELGQVYKTQGQNAQRLLAMSETLRQSEDKSRDEQEQLRSLRTEVDKLARRAQDNASALKEKEKAIQHLNDELSTAHLEYTQLEKRNQDLQIDNKSLLQRWLDKMNEEVSQINDANAFIESTSKLKSTTNNHSTSAGSKTTSSRPSSRPSSPTRSAKAASSSGRRTPTFSKSKPVKSAKSTAPHSAATS